MGGNNRVAVYNALEQLSWKPVCVLWTLRPGTHTLPWSWTVEKLYCFTCLASQWGTVMRRLKILSNKSRQTASTNCAHVFLVLHTDCYRTIQLKKTWPTRGFLLQPYPRFPGTGHSTKKGPSKLTQGPFLCYINGRRFYAIHWLSKLKRKWWNNFILVACISIGGTHDLQPKMVWFPLIVTWWVYHLLQAVTLRFVALWQKYNCPFAKYCCSALWLWNVAPNGL